MTIQRVSLDTHSSSSWKYDVFLSFKGEDTRKNFIDHLYAALNREGIEVFKDDKALERGKPISPELLQAIEQSRFSIVVFSSNYASSTWCLDELVKIVECMNTMTQTVLPIFYDVDPSMVRKQTGKFKEAFAKHEETFRENIQKVEAWRRALKKVTDISGWDAKDRHESDFIQGIVKEISSKLILPTSMNSKDQVAIDSHLEKLRLLIGEESCDVRMIGICGIGGIGKTTIARVVYDLISSQFEGSSFLADVREKFEKGNIISLQKQLLSQILKGKNFEIWDVDSGISEIRKRLQYKKVLVVIDDVAHVNQLKILAGAHDWFGLGSRIIITTRDKSLLCEVDQMYEVEELKDYDALRLFSLKAFKGIQPADDYMELSKCVIKFAGGLPLALEVLGSFLRNKTIDEWKDAIKRLHTENEIFDKLQISFDGLKKEEKDIFLDIACFFKGENKDYVIKILDGCGFHPIIGIRVLIDRSLIIISKYNTIWMHDLLQEMGQQIVKGESPKEPGKRSRLWKEVDIHHVLTENTGTELVEGLMLKRELHFRVSAKAFSKMVNLRLLEIHNVQLPDGLEYLSNKLRLLKWHGYPLKSLPSSVQPDKIVELELHCCSIKQLWKGINTLNNLTSIYLNDCPNLCEVPDLTWAPNLEELCFVKLPRLRGIHSPLFVHKKLVYLEVNNCISLTNLPSKIHIESLEQLEIADCPKLKKFPEIGGSKEKLRYLCIDGTAIKDMPLSIELLTVLETLILTNNGNLMALPSTINGMTFLRTLDLSGCSNLVSLPSTINGMTSLQTLYLSSCSKLEKLPENLDQVESLEQLDLSGTAITQSVFSIFHMMNLEGLSFHGCKGPTSKSWVMQFFDGLIPRGQLDSKALVLPSFSNLCFLGRLDLSDCNLGEGAIHRDFFSNMVSLYELNLSKNNFVSLPTSISHLSNLICLYLEGCKSLQSLPKLGSRMRILVVDGCASLEISSNTLKSISSNYLWFSSVDCLKLSDRNNFIRSMLEGFLVGVENVKGCYSMFSIVVPGDEIPKWIRYQSEGCSITIKGPSNLHNNKLVGYFVCSVFVVHKHLPVGGGTHHIYCVPEIDGRNQLLGLTEFNEEFGHAISEHLWLRYVDVEQITEYGLQLEWKCIKFLFETDGQGLEVKMCGAHPVYEQDLKELNPIVDVTTPKRSLALNDNDEEPQPKRFKRFNFF